MKRLLIPSLIGLALSTSCSAAKDSPAYTTVAEAAAALPGFPMVGEYVSNDGKSALQANLLSDGSFLVAQYQKGLPGGGWDKSAIDSSILAAPQLKTLLGGFRKVERESPTLGKPQPEDAIIKFPDDLGNVTDGIMAAGGETLKDLGSFHMHLEFMLPLKPGANPSSQHRGNSGIYIFHNYEVQVLDSFAVDYEHPGNNAIQPESENKQWCGSLYKMKLPDVNMTYPPLRWQTYDINFTAPVFEGDKKVKNARVTVRHNGVLIHDDVELLNGTGAGAKRPQVAKGPVMFQSHGNPVVFRNVWATELKGFEPQMNADGRR